MIRSEMAQQTPRTFVSPSIATDHKDNSSKDLLSSLLANWQMNAPLAMGGLWLLRRFPKTTLLGLVAAGAYLAYQKNVGGIQETLKREANIDLH